MDIDWESSTPGDASATNFVNLMRSLSKALHADSKLLTAAIIGAGRLGAGIQTDVFEIVDYLGLMAYGGDNDAGHTPYKYAEDAVNYWIGRGLSSRRQFLVSRFTRVQVGRITTN